MTLKEQFASPASSWLAQLQGDVEGMDYGMEKDHAVVSRLFLMM